MKVLITGGAGFIGSHLAKHCLLHDHEVTIIDNLITGNHRNIEPLISKPGCTFLEADIVSFDFNTLDSFDVVFHLASPASPVQYSKYPLQTLRTNAEGTHRVLEFMRRTNSPRFLLASTSEVYGDPKEHPQKEEYWGNVNSFGPRSCYDEAKRYAEAITYTYGTTYGIDVRVARIFNTYGPAMEPDDGRVVSNFITQCISGKDITVFGNGSQTRSLCYVSDMVHGLYELATRDGLGMEVINLGNPNEKTVLEIAKIIKTITGSDSEIVYKPIGKDDPQRRRPDITKARLLLGWEPAVELEAGLVYTVEYFRNLL
ncbi:MAG: GDP-mannose 4,6-dehydratase [Patescibacteria group bacterium]|nr:GDP-mannose 4,6-dehydratase [Patescibacteria group bacterium]